MSHIVNISSETAALIESHARQRGVSVDEYLRTLLPESNDLGLRGGAAALEFRRDMESLADDREQTTPYGGTYSREDIYADHK